MAGEGAEFCPSFIIPKIISYDNDAWRMGRPPKGVSFDVHNGKSCRNITSICHDFQMIEQRKIKSGGRGCDSRRGQRLFSLLRPLPPIFFLLLTLNRNFHGFT